MNINVLIDPTISLITFNYTFHRIRKRRSGTNLRVTHILAAELLSLFFFLIARFITYIVVQDKRTNHDVIYGWIAGFYCCGLTALPKDILLVDTSSRYTRERNIRTGNSERGSIQIYKRSEFYLMMVRLAHANLTRRR